MEKANQILIQGIPATKTVDNLEIVVVMAEALSEVEHKEANEMKMATTTETTAVTTKDKRNNLKHAMNSKPKIVDRFIKKKS